MSNMNKVTDWLISMVCAMIAACIMYVHATYPVVVFDMVWTVLMYAALPMCAYCVARYMHASSRHDYCNRTRHHTKASSCMDTFDYDAPRNDRDNYYTNRKAK